MPEEVDWVEKRTGSPESCFALALALKGFQKMARFPSPDEIPEVVIDHVRRCLELPEDAGRTMAPPASAKAHRKLVRQRQGVTHDVLGCRFGVDRSTVTRAIHQIRPLLAERGCSITAGRRLRTLADVVSHLGSSGQEAILDATGIRVRRPAAGAPERDRFISGKAG
ncbi:transposase family protein [Streptosporangium canum]|uniref:helix-turn-helix domain-containing protein n=1 Tax=Streptosporangium canum TaxID=324952 RepID=UPI003420FFCA